MKNAIEVMVDDIFELPVGTQVVAMWTYDDKIWSETVLVCDGGRIEEYDPDKDEFVPRMPFTSPQKSNMRYFITEV